MATRRMIFLRSPVAASAMELHNDPVKFERKHVTSTGNDYQSAGPTLRLRCSGVREKQDDTTSNTRNHFEALGKKAASAPRKS